MKNVVRFIHFEIPTVEIEDLPFLPRVGELIYKSMILEHFREQHPKIEIMSDLSERYDNNLGEYFLIKQVTHDVTGENKQVVDMWLENDLISLY